MKKPRCPVGREAQELIVPGWVSLTARRGKQKIAIKLFKKSHAEACFIVLLALYRDGQQVLTRAPRRIRGRNEEMELKAHLAALAEAASAAGLPAATEKQVDYIIALMARKNISIALFDGQTMMTKRGASNYINDLKVIQAGVV